MILKIVDNPRIMIDMLKELFSWSTIPNIAKTLYQQGIDVFSGDAYTSGKAIAELGLITTGAGMS
jgi:hypothetical protein